MSIQYKKIVKNGYVIYEPINLKQKTQEQVNALLIQLGY